MPFYRLLWLLPIILLTLALLVLMANEYAMARSSRRTKDIPYVPANSPDFNAGRHLLDVYSPRAASAAKLPVVVFIHGGGWNSGSKNLYTFIGRRLAKQERSAKAVIGVIINYRLAPNVAVPAMVDDCARAVLWVKQHIAEYGGDPNRIFVMGHSAGGGLAALLATKDSLFTRLGQNENPVKGAILDDPAGLDMFDYLKKMEYPNDEQYLVPFGKDSTVWREMSAIYHLTAKTPPMLVYVGERTYPSIVSSTRKFRQQLQELGINHQFTQIPRKTHIGMVLQLFWKKNIIYNEMLKFVGAVS